MKAVPAEVEAPGEAPSKISPVPPTTDGAPKANPLVEVPPKAGAVPPTPTADDGKLLIKAPGDSLPAAETLKKFFAASSIEERLGVTQAPDKMKPLMERYYEANPDAPLRVKAIELLRHDKKPETGAPLCVFQVYGPDVPEPLPVMAESTPEGWKVDWLTFTEFKDKLLLEYLKKWQDNPGRFHVLLRRTHYFDEDVPDLDKKACFEVTSPVPGFQGFTFVPKNSALAKELDRTVTWDVSGVAAIVELQWKKKDRYQWVEITSLPQYNWRNTIAEAPSTPPKARPVEQPAKPKAVAKEK